MPRQQSLAMRILMLINFIMQYDLLKIILANVLVLLIDSNNIAS